MIQLKDNEIIVFSNTALVRDKYGNPGCIDIACSGCVFKSGKWPVSYFGKLGLVDIVIINIL